MASLSRILKQLSEVTGKLVAWLTLPMVLGTFVVVVLRYAFDLGWIWMQESVVWLHAVVFMLAGAYTFNADEHVRVDIFYRQMSSLRRAWVNLIGTLLFLLPVCLFMLVTSADYVAVSWTIGEGSREAGGLPFPFVPLLKSMIPLAFILLIGQGIATLIDSGFVIRGHTDDPGSDDDA